ncbi:MAG: hypothetical protein JW913_09360 [Chitinispirillaceae bacterium]|nr:hypothetical protein [Chitinispirillaceae bacterium]
MRKITGLLIMCLVTLAIAGPNNDAKLYIDFSVNSEAIDSMGSCAAESTIVTAVRITGAVKLFSYQFYINYDTSSLQFVSGKVGNGNFLEENGGNCFFMAKRSIHDSTRILVGNSLVGSEEDKCVSDSGLLGLFTFKHKKDDTTQLSIDSVELIDCGDTPDSDILCFSGTILPSNDEPVTHHPARRHRSPILSVANGSVNVEFAGKTDYVLTVVNTIGKKLYSNKGYSDRIRFDGHDVGLAPRASSLVVVRICYSGSELVVPLIR